MITGRDNRLHSRSAIALGLFARPVAFVASGMMAVAYLWMHFPDGFWPSVNGGEAAVLY